MKTALKTAAAAATLSLTATLLSSCATADTADNAGLLNVVATATQVGDFTQQVGGEEITLTTLLSPGGSAHSYEPTPADMIALADADVLVINGMDLEEFLDSAIETSGFDGLVVDASTHIVSEGLAEGGKAEGEAAHSEGEAAHSEGEAAHSEESGDDHAHDHSGDNPHIWTSPVMAAEMVDSIAEGLSEASPENAELFAANAAAYDAQLAALDAWIAENMAQVPAAERLFVSGHNALDYYLDRYSITYIGSVLPNFEDNAEPSVADIDQLVSEMNAAGVKAIFVEASMNPKTAQLIADQTGATLIEDDVIYVDSLGTTGSGAETYIMATVLNTEILINAWGYETTPFEAE